MRKKPLRILYVNGGLMDRGGVSSVMMSYYLKFDPTLVYVDFVVHGNGVGERDEEIINRGSKIFKIPPKSRNPVGNYWRLKKIINDGKYDIVHAHADSGNALILKIAEECGIKCRISHSHNTDLAINNKIRIFLAQIQKKQISRYATHKWACSKAAGEWLYGKLSKFDVIPNAIDVTRYKYNSELRNQLRVEYGLEDKVVVGHVGRFDYQKNQCFLIDAFANAIQEKENLRLVLVGDGKDRLEIERKIYELNLDDKVLLLGRRNDVNFLVNMFDIFVLPSRFEGLPVVIVEAQTNGLYCLCSNLVTEETDLTGNVEYLPLDVSKWRDEMIKTFERDNDSIAKIIGNGYEINSAAEKLQTMYLKIVC